MGSHTVERAAGMVGMDRGAGKATIAYVYCFGLVAPSSVTYPLSAPLPSQYPGYAA